MDVRRPVRQQVHHVRRLRSERDSRGQTTATTVAARRTVGRRGCRRPGQTSRQDASRFRHEATRHDRTLGHDRSASLPTGWICPVTGRAWIGHAVAFRNRRRNELERWLRTLTFAMVCSNPHMQATHLLPSLLARAGCGIERPRGPVCNTGRGIANRRRFQQSQDRVCAGPMDVVAGERARPSVH